MQPLHPLFNSFQIWKSAWLSHKNFKASVKTWWGSIQEIGWEGYKFTRNFKVKMLRWNKQLFGNLDVKYGELEIRLNKLDERESGGSWSFELSNERRTDKCEMEEMLFRRNQMDSQKAKVKW